MKETEVFRIRAYGWQELASLYSPEITAGAAVKRLRRWVRLHPELQEQLTAYGWNKADRVLTPKMVQVIVDYLGEP